MQLVRVQTEEERQLAELTLRIRWQEDHNATLHEALEPIQHAFEDFEQRYSRRLGPLAVELQRIRAKTERIASFTTRLQARLVSDPDHVLGDVFAPSELREIGDMFGIDVPNEWFPANKRPPSDDPSFDDSVTDEERQAFHELTLRRKPKHDAAQRREIRTRYRALARAFHPDLARSDEERHFRQEVMFRINHAWHCQDLSQLIAIADEVQLDLAGWSASPLSQRLAWARREYRRLTEEGTATAARLQQLQSSATYPLWFNAQLADVTIAKRVAVMRRDIANETDRQERVIGEFKESFAAYAGA